jgi:hypothetical protein
MLSLPAIVAIVFVAVGSMMVLTGGLVQLTRVGDYNDTENLTVAERAAIITQAAGITLIVAGSATLLYLSLV